MSAQSRCWENGVCVMCGCVSEAVRVSVLAYDHSKVHIWDKRYGMAIFSGATVKVRSGVGREWRWRGGISSSASSECGNDIYVHSKVMG